MEAQADYRRFLKSFAESSGAIEIWLITLFLSLGIGATITLIPSEMADRFARLHHDYVGAHCGVYTHGDKPMECQYGADEAQEASTWSNMTMCLLLLLCNPVIGSVSDARGRRNMILASLTLTMAPAAAFAVLLQSPSVSPFWYYAANSLAGAISYISLIFAAMSDVIAEDLRAPSFGLVFAALYGGYALGPLCTIFLSPLHCALYSLSLGSAALAIGCLFLPETRLSVRESLVGARSEDSLTNPEILPNEGPSYQWLWNTAMRPLRDVSILNRNWTLRLLTAGSFFSAMVFASDATLVLYYIQSQLDIQISDLAAMFLLLGIFGIICQGGLLQPLTTFMGEKALLVTTFGCGVCHNLVYGISRTKYGICLAFVISQLTKLNFPLLSSMASRCATEHEQGRVQGALFATNAVANAVGPLIMQCLYRQTEYTKLGPGFMWIFAAFLYLIGTIIVSLVPMDMLLLNNDSSMIEEGCLTTRMTDLKDDISQEGPHNMDGEGLNEPLLASA